MVESKFTLLSGLYQGPPLERDGAAGLQRLQCGVRQCQCFDPVAAAGQRWRAAGQRVDEMVELEPVGLGIAFEKERQRLFADDSLRADKRDRAEGNIVGSERTVRTKDLDALVVAIGGAAAVRDLAERARPVRKLTTAVSTSPASPIAGSISTLAAAKTSTGSSSRSQRAMSKSWIIISRNRPPETRT